MLTGPRIGPTPSYPRSILRSAGINCHAVAATVMDAADQIAKLAALRDQGILTDEEFQRKKTQVLE